MTPPLALETLFPALTVDEVSPRHVALLGLCAQIGAPYPAERNKPYASWWRALHEIGHWAVKPEWYVDYASYLWDDLRVRWGEGVIPQGTVAGVSERTVIPKLSVYRAGNDVIPQIGMHDDPTPSEMETRVWVLQTLELFGWPHPFDENVNGVKTGDAIFHKFSSWEVWARYQLSDPVILASMERWSLSPREGLWRPTSAPGAPAFSLPFPHPTAHDELFANMEAIREVCGVTEGGSPGRRADAREFVMRRWPEDDLQERYRKVNGRTQSAT